MAKESPDTSADIERLLSGKQTTQILVGLFSILIAGAGSIGYLVIDRLFSDLDQGRNGTYQATNGITREQLEQYGEQIRQRLFETCQATREANNLRIDALQWQVNDVAELVAEIKADDDKLELTLDRHIAEYRKHETWGKDVRADNQLRRGKVDAQLNHLETRINELYRLYRSYFRSGQYRSGGTGVLDFANGARRQYATSGE